jgi:hypothetical protein
MLHLTDRHGCIATDIKYRRKGIRYLVSESMPGSMHGCSRERTFPPNVQGSHRPPCRLLTLSHSDSCCCILHLQFLGHLNQQCACCHCCLPPPAAKQYTPPSFILASPAPSAAGPLAVGSFRVIPSTTSSVLLLSTDSPDSLLRSASRSSHLQHTGRGAAAP